MGKVKEQELLELLVNEDYLSKDEAIKAWQESRKSRSYIVDYLKENNLISEEIIAMAVAEKYGLSVADFNAHQPSTEEIELLPRDFAQENRVVVYQIDKRKAIFATDKANNPDLEPNLSKIFKNRKIELRFALSNEIDEALINYRESLDTRFNQIIKSGVKIAPDIIEAIVIDAAAMRASDIHFEPEPEKVTIRIRVDGVLQDSGNIDKNLYQNIINRIKVMAKLRIDEHNTVQDGSIQYSHESTGLIDMRISIAPTVSGEKIVIRLLTSHNADFTLNDLGLSPEHKKIIEVAGKKPFGMIVVTGPTGSGKTTTLYSLIKYIKNREINITTIEDPVEYVIPGIAQMQVDSQTNFNFSEGLRSIVRQDPDVILVGEIRDLPTAEIAVNAALTGHLMLTTFHSNDAATAIPRLLELGTEPFLLASTLELVVAQRLIRKLCQSCRISTELNITSLSANLNLDKQSTTLLKNLLSKSKTNIYKGKGCKICNHTGYKGRIGIYEFIVLNDQLKELILKKPSKNEIWELAYKTNSKSLFEDGIQKVCQGYTTIEELLRVSPIPSMVNNRKSKSING